MNDILSIVVAKYILLYYFRHSWIFIKIDWNSRAIMASNLDGLHNDINNLKFKIKQND